MKKVLFLFAILAGYMSFYSTETHASIKDARIYINPGHGSWGGEDRHMGTVKHGAPNYTDTSGFFESNTNLEKGFGMLEKLIEYGVPFDRSKNQSNSNLARLGAALDLSQTNIVMSRVKNGPYPHDGSSYGAYSRPLSEIATEVENWGADVFISIHSNAITEGSTTNYPIYLYRGYDNNVYAGDSKNIAAKCWQYSIENPHMMWTNYTNSTNIRGDISFWNETYTTTINGYTYYGYYGVLRHGTQGFLVEGYFHTYQPARHKAMNWDVCRIEGAGYAKGFRDYFGAGNAVGTGDIYGILRDADETFTHTYYIPNANTDDKYKPINGATVTLKKPDGTVVKTYTTDDEYNGAFVFNKITPGTYTLEFSHEDYKVSTQQVSVTADKVVYPSVKLSKTTEQIPVRGHYAYDLSMTQNGDDYTLKFKSTGAVDKGYVILTNKSTGKKQAIEIDNVVAGENTKIINAFELGTNATFTWSITLDNPRSTGYELMHSDNSIIYTHKEGSTNYPARIGLAIDKDPESDTYGSIFSITAFGQGIQRFNPDYSKNGAKLATGKFGLDTDASTSTNKYVRSNRLAISNGKVYIANFANQNTGISVFNPNDNSTKSIINTKYERSVGFSGNGENRIMYASYGTKIRYFKLGTTDSWTDNDSESPSGSYALSMLGNGDGDMLITDKGIFASQNRFSGNNTSDNPIFVFIDNSGTKKFDSTDNSIASVLSASQCGGMAITDDLSTFAIVDGYTEGSPADIEIDVFSVTWSGETPSFSHKYSIPLSGTKQVDQMEFDPAGNLVVASQQKGLLVYTIKQPTRQTATPAKASLTIQGKVLPAVKGQYAYDLKMTQDGDTYTLKFKSTGAVANANIVFTNTADSEDTKTVEINNVVAGENTVTLNAADFGKNANYTWAVVIDNPTNSTIELMHSDNSIIYTHKEGSTNYPARIGLAIDKDPESDTYGSIFSITAFGQGIQRFNPDYSKNGAKLATGKFGLDTDASTSTNKYVRSNRLAISNGKVYIANFANQNTGISVFNPNDNSTKSIINTKYERSVGFSGNGENRIMYASYGTKIRYFKLGTTDSWTDNDSESPSGSYALSMLGNGDGDMLITDKGIFASQNRFSGNNTSDNPIFVFIDNSGTKKFDSTDNSIASVLSASQCGGMAITDDLSTFAIVDGYTEGSPADIEIDVFSVTWSGETPSFSHKYSIPLSGTKQVDQMEFDPAGNLVVASQQKGLLVYAVKNPARTTVTPAKSTLVIAGKYIPGTEGHFAYDLEMEETSEGYTLKFKSTGDVDNAKLVLTEVGDAKEVNTTEQEIGAVTKGENSIELITESLPYGTQTWAVILENAASEGAEVIKSDASVAFENKAQGGVAVDKDTESANFGKIYTVTAYAQGLQEFDASMNPVGERLFKDTPFIDAWYSPYRITANSGKLYMNDWIDSNSGVYVYDPNAETISAPNMFVGTRPDDGAGIMVNENGETVTCNVSSVAFVGEGEGRKMYAFAEDAVNEAPAGSLLRYDLGTADTWAAAPSAAFSSMSSLLSTKDAVLLATENGIICAQKSENSNTAEKPAFVVVDFDGNVVYNSSALTDLNGSMGAAVALYGNIFAIVNADGNIEIYKVAWNENTPSFSDRYVIKLNNTKQITQMDFDTAGNLYAFSVEEGLLKIAVKNEARSTRTNAKAELQLVNSILTAVESIEVEAPAEYYNLQGIKVDKPGNGIFIKKQGSKASKVIL